MSEQSGAARQESMASAINCPLSTVEVVKYFNAEAMERIAQLDPRLATAEILSAIEDEGEAIAELCEVDTGLALLWSSYAAVWFALRAQGWEALAHEVTYQGRGYEPLESWLQIMHGACRTGWEARASNGFPCPHLPPLGSLLTQELEADAL